MKNIHKLLVLGITFLVSAVYAESMNDKLWQSWQAAKEKAKKTGAAVVDAVNVDKYMKLATQAQDDFEKCVDQNCLVELEKMNNLKKGRRYKYEEAADEYRACVKNNCSDQQALAGKNAELYRKSLNRQLAAIMGTVFASSLLLAGVVGGSVAIGVAFSMNEEQKKAFNKRLTSLAQQHSLTNNPTALKYFGWVVAAKEFGKGYNDDLLGKTIKAYMKEAFVDIDNLDNDPLVKALVSYTGKTMKDFREFARASQGD